MSPALLWFSAAAAAPLDPLLLPEGSLDFPRSAAGVAAAVGEILPLLQGCLHADTPPGVRLVRLQFSIDEDGILSLEGRQWTGDDGPLAECMATAFDELRFQPGEQVVPVEVPVSVVVESESRLEIRSPVAKQ